MHVVCVEELQKTRDRYDNDNDDMKPWAEPRPAPKCSTDRKSVYHFYANCVDDDDDDEMVLVQVSDRLYPLLATRVFKPLIVFRADVSLSNGIDSSDRLSLDYFGVGGRGPVGGGPGQGGNEAWV